MKTFLFLLCCSSIISCTAQKTNTPQKLSPVSFKASMDSSAQKQVLDVRTPDEFNTGHLAGAVNMNIYDADFLQQLQTLDKNKPVLLYCKAGGRSAEAATQLQQLGFTDIRELQGGILNWEKQNLPLDKVAADVDADRFTVQQFDSLLNAHTNLLVDFYADWCGPCKQMEPALNKLAKQYSGRLTVYRINVDEAKRVAKKLGIEGLPYVAYYKRGALVQAVTGLQSYKALKSLVDR